MTINTSIFDDAAKSRRLNLFAQNYDMLLLTDMYGTTSKPPMSSTTVTTTTGL